MSLDGGESVGHSDMLLQTTVIEVCNPQNLHHTSRLIFHQSAHGNFHVLRKKKISLDRVCLHSCERIGQRRTDVAPEWIIGN